MRRIVGFLLVVFAVCVAPSRAGVAWPLRVAPDGRHLVDADGAPFLLVGDAAWSMTVNLAPEEMDRYFADRAAKGFNTILLRGIDAYTSWGGPDDYQGQSPFTCGDYDWSVRNEPYWQTLDAIVAKARDHEMLVLLAHSYLGFQCGVEGWCSMMLAQSDAAMVEYGTWVGNRYRGYGNVLWVDGGDCDATQYGLAIDRVTAVKNGIVSVDPGTVRTAHTGRNDDGVLDYPWIDTHPAYSECDLTSLRIRNDYVRVPARPVFLIEARYEGEGATTTCLASQAFWSVLGGGVGHVFGNKPVWIFGPGWEGPSGMGSTGSAQMGNIARLLRSRAWWRLEPDYAHAVVTAGFGTIGSSSYVGVARTSDGETVVAHVPNASTTLTVDMGRIAGPQAHVWWTDPVTGAASDAGTFDTSGLRDFTATTGNLALVIDSVSPALPAPGTTVYPIPRPLPPVAAFVILEDARQTGGTVDLTMHWEPVAEAMGYRVYRASHAAGQWNDVVDVQNPCADTCTFTWKGLAADGASYFVVTGYSGDSESPLH